MSTLDPIQTSIKKSSSKSSIFDTPAINIIGAACGANCGPDGDTYYSAAYLRDLYDILHVNPKFHNAPLSFFQKTSFHSIVDELDYDHLQEYARTRAFSEALAETVSVTKDQNRFPIVIGGDHSCAIGTWRGVSAHTEGAIGLIWIDAHMDSHTDETTPSGAIHGMPLASLMGYGHPSLVNDWKHHQAVDPKYTTLIGIRSYEPEEKALLESLGVTIIYADPKIKTDYVSAFEQAVERAMQCPHGFGISFDLDVLDPVDMPHVACYVPDGLAWVEVESMIESLTEKQIQHLHAFEIVEFAPNIANFNDREQKMTPLERPISAYDSGSRVFKLIGSLLS
ncbi:arginase family protein [Ewingella americana]|uniref:Arginase n=1 Tax=Ewingella americana TaxID=41202 RepID=A0A502GF92_9GAMM|nr:arginase family protein [Ewingella americana]TPG59960.1 arginase [Ewingella americana]